MVLSAHSVAVSRGPKTVLADISVALRTGRITAICGPNGAGKSTLLSALAGLIEPSQGHVQLNGAPLLGIAPEKRASAIGFLPQEGEIAWDLSVANLAALGQLPRRTRDFQAISRALAKVGMGAFAQRPVSTLSGGEKARALLARVLAGEPRWLLVDEPLAALDLAHRQGILHQLRSEAEAGAGVAIVLHDLAQAMNHADDVLVLDRGRLAAHGAPVDALSSDIIARIWGVSARWIGDAGAQALVIAD